MSERVFFAPSATECGYAFQVADDAGAVVDVVRTAGGTGVQGAFVDVAAFVADGDAHVHAEVVAAGLGGDVQERAVAGFRQGFVEVQVQRGAAVEPVHQFFAVQQEFVERVDFFVFDDVEIGVVAFAADLVAVGFVPFGVFHAEVFGGNELSVELHAVVLAGGLVGFEYGFQTTLDEVDVIVVVADFDALRLGGSRHTVDTDGEELFVQRDEACIVNGQHSGGLIFFHQFAVGVLIFVDFGDFGGKVAPVLLQPVHVDGDDVDGTGCHAARAECIAEGSVFNGVAQTAAGSQGVGIVGKIDEEGIALRQLFRHCVGEHGVFAFAAISQHRSGHDGESQNGFGAFLIEPFEEEVLQLRHARPHRFAEIGEDEIAEHCVEIVLIVNGNIPEYALIAARGSGLVDAVHHLLHVVGDFFAVGFQIIVAIVFAGKVVEIGQKFHRRHRAGKLRADGKHQVDKRTAKRSQMLRCFGFAAEFA